MKRGFTIIELLVVIAIIGILSAVVLTSVSSARQKSRDSRRMSEIKTLETALRVYYTNYGSYPPNPVPGSGVCGTQFVSALAPLVTAGLMSSIPTDPSNPNGYCYYNYGPGTIGALVVTQLESIADTTTGPNNTCRPFTANWCSYTVASKYYCSCSVY